MNGEEIEEQAVKLKISEAKRRRKKDAGDSDLEREEEEERGEKKSATSNSTTVHITKILGCPPNYERITEYICLRFGMVRDIRTSKPTNKYLVAGFEDAKSECLVDHAKLLYFSNSDEATKIWKWLGKNTI